LGIKIEKEAITKQILQGMTIPELMKYYSCSKYKITRFKRINGLVGLSPNIRKRDNGDGTKFCPSCNTIKRVEEFHSNGYTPSGLKN
jgi:hypothetical protein